MYPTPEDHFNTLDQTVPNETERELVRRFAPCILFDANEPFFPSVVGYTLFRQNDDSPSFPRRIELHGDIALVIEYAIWWDWDIQHLYELEHIWVYLNQDDDVVRVDASWHGGWNQMVRDDGSLPLVDGRVTLCSEPGKHAFAPTPTNLLERRPTTDASTGQYAGMGGVLVTPLFNGMIQDRTPPNNRVVRAYLERLRFSPTYDFSQAFMLEEAAFVPWDTLFQWIPERVNWWVNHLQREIPHNQRHIWRIAHRGASAHAQEGSASSIRKAVELGADMIEMDIRFTADNVPVVFHDSNLKRVFGVDGEVAEMDIATLKSITPEGHETILTFAEMVELCRSLRVGLYLDIKAVNPEGVAAIFAILDEHHMFNFAIFGSFRPDWLAEIKRHRPDAITSILFASTAIKPVEMAAAVGADYVHPCFERSEEPEKILAGDWLAQVRAAGLGVVCWHEERPEVIAALYELGVDGICSDMPELLTAQATSQQRTIDG